MKGSRDGVPNNANKGSKNGKKKVKGYTHFLLRPLNQEDPEDILC